MANTKGILSIIVGTVEIAVAIVATVFSLGLAAPAAAMLIASGAGMIMSGIGTLLTAGPLKGLATTERNSVAPWKICYGRVSNGGTLVYEHSWGNNNQMLDMVIVLAAHECEPLNDSQFAELLFDQQRIQIDTSAVPTSALAGYSVTTPVTGSGTSFTPVQQTVNCSSVIRNAFGVVTVIIDTDIPYLTSGDQVQLVNVTGDLTLNGTFQVAEIISRVPSGGTNILTFTYLSGGTVADVVAAGQVKTLWPDYGRNVYIEFLDGTQTLGETFTGMTAGTPALGLGASKLVTPLSVGPAGGTNAPNPWTQYCSLLGKTAVFLRLTYQQKFFPQGIPQISFRHKGKNDILDNRTGFDNVATGGTGYIEGDVITVVQSGATGGQLDVVTVDGSGGITSSVIHADGSGYVTASGLATTGGTGSGATATVSYTGSYGYTENAALCIADYLNQGDLSDERNRLPWGFGAAYGTDIPQQPLFDAANVCDEAVDLVIGGTEPRYACNGQFELTMDRGTILQNLLTSCGGRLVYSEGQYTIQPAQWLTPLATAVDFQAIATGAMKWKPSVTIRELYNGVKATYVSPDNKWMATDIPPYMQDSDHGYDPENLYPQYGGDINLAADHGERRFLNAQFPFTISSGTAQRLAKIELLRRRYQGSGTFICNMSAYQYLPLDVIKGDSTFFDWTNKELEISAVRLTPEDEEGVISLKCELDVKETDESIYVWSTEEELSPQGYIQSNFPKNLVQELTCYPWSPGYIVPLAGDVFEGAPATFGLKPIYGEDAGGNGTISLQIKGTPPVNQLADISAPNFFLTATTGGTLAAADYIVGISARNSSDPTEYENTDYHVLGSITTPASGKIELTIEYGSGDVGCDIWLAKYDVNGYVFHWNQTLDATTTTATISTFDVTTPGGPDTIFDHFGVIWQEVVHGGPWAEQVQALTSTTLTIYGPGMTDNQWAGYTLSLLAKEDMTVEVPIINLPVESSTASDGTTGMFVLTIGPNALSNQIADLTTLLAIGDLVLCRYNATFTSTTLTDANIANGFYPLGATAVEAGHVCVCLTGENAGDVQTINGVTADGDGNIITFNLATPWTITPATGDIVLVCKPSNVPEVDTLPVSAKNQLVVGIMAQPDVSNLADAVWLFRVRTEDINNAYGPDQLIPYREIWFFGNNATGTGPASFDVTRPAYGQIQLQNLDVTTPTKQGNANIHAQYAYVDETKVEKYATLTADLSTTNPVTFTVAINTAGTAKYSAFAVNDLLVFNDSLGGYEIVQLTAISGTSWTINRRPPGDTNPDDALLGSSISDHSSGTQLYKLDLKHDYIQSQIGSSVSLPIPVVSSGSLPNTITTSLPSACVVAAMTYTTSDGGTSDQIVHNFSNPSALDIDSGIPSMPGVRTLAGNAYFTGQYQGELVAGFDSMPVQCQDWASMRCVYATVTTAPTGSDIGITVYIQYPGDGSYSLLASLSIPAGTFTSYDAAGVLPTARNHPYGFLWPVVTAASNRPLEGDALVKYHIDYVGATTPGDNLTVVVQT